MPGFVSEATDKMSHRLNSLSTKCPTFALSQKSRGSPETPVNKGDINHKRLQFAHKK